jgi:hypothetical protein
MPITTGPAARFAAALALLLLPRFASAGEIPWSYRASVIVDHDLGWMYTGSEEYATESGMMTVYGFAYLPQGSEGVREGSAAGVQLAGLSKAGYTYRFEPPDPRALNAVFLRLEVTDTASGQADSADFFLSASLLSVLPSELRAEALIHAGGEARFLLGGNRYDLRVYDGDTDSNSWIYTDVTVTPTAATPEPGTLALAGIGLAPLTGVFARRLRRS